MKDKIEIGVKETAILKVMDTDGSNITNCTCLVVKSNIWESGGRRGTTIPNPKIGESYKMISEVVPFGSGINWEIRSVEKLS